MVQRLKYEMARVLRECLRHAPACSDSGGESGTNSEDEDERYSFDQDDAEEWQMVEAE
jgi:hypothetical protein